MAIAEDTNLFACARRDLDSIRPAQALPIRASLADKFIEPDMFDFRELPAAFDFEPVFGRAPLALLLLWLFVGVDVEPFFGSGEPPRPGSQSSPADAGSGGI